MCVIRLRNGTVASLLSCFCLANLSDILTIAAGGFHPPYGGKPHAKWEFVPVCDVFGFGRDGGAACSGFRGGAVCAFWRRRSARV